MNGLLNVYKPTGPTSHDIVSRLRRILGIRRIGHSGTLDPLADGVLLMAVGSATRLLEYTGDLPKLYRAAARFGEATDTQDVTGEVLEEKDASALTREQVEAALGQFTGEIEQVPPMHSALKVGGQPLYLLARRGESVERPARRVTISRFELEGFEPGPKPTAQLLIECSAGTYVRTLCHDLGQKLGTGGTMAALTRSAIGPFSVDEATSTEELARLQEAGEPLPWIPPERALAHLACWTAPPEAVEALRQGRRVDGAAPGGSGLVVVLDPGGGVVAVARRVAGEDRALLAPEKVFV